ncbi:membrane protein [Pandoraea terrae]|uniref:Probable membrane transporter protein n=1 Tax=Pandoraea terrae TaxID=1537710 RepID=A0A5E4RJK7_9BURK|nr:sulfite exporter TauE/SafE family protein [Pandoraea terrae]VVD62108.1 membrane protein [Pandoraea terrae]
MSLWLEPISGFGVGLLVGMTGVGGGSLMTPLLTLLLGYTAPVAVGTDLAFAAITKSFGTAAHRSHGHVKWAIVKRLTFGALPAALVTILALKRLGGIEAGALHAIKLTIAVSVLLTVLSLLFRARLLSALRAHPAWQLHGRHQAAATVFVGAVIGVLVTVSSIGAGAVGATLILLLYPELEPAEVAGTDIAYAVPLTAMAALGHIWLNTVHWTLLGSLLIGSLPGIWLGAKLTRHLPERIVRGALAATLTLAAVKLVA